MSPSSSSEREVADSVRRPTLASADTAGYSACSAEFCPVEGELSRFLAVGTYQIAKGSAIAQAGRATVAEEHADEAGSLSEGGEQDALSPPTTRLGKLLLYEVNGGNDGIGIPKLEERQSIDTPAILDMKWAKQTIPGPRHQTLAIANAAASVTLFALCSEDDRPPLFREEASCRVNNEDKLCLSLDWADFRHASPATIVVSQSDGSLATLRLAEGGRLVKGDAWTAHGFEAWIAAFDRANSALVYSGGDDCKLKGWDLRTSCATPTFVSRRHSMGVTAIESNSLAPHLLATGSYDEHILIWDHRSLAVPLHDVGTGGGVWRLRWHPRRPDVLLAACMHGGLRVIRVGEASCRISSSFLDHQSMAYGADWSRAVPRDEGCTLVGSCSFYDHALHLWYALPFICLYDYNRKKFTF